MSKEKRKRKASKTNLEILDDNDKCEIISSSISKMIATSGNSDFVNDCRRILQAESKDQMKNKLRNKFSEAMTNKKSRNPTSSNSLELDDPSNSFLQNTENIFSYDDELAGFADWEHL